MEQEGPTPEQIIRAAEKAGFSVSKNQLHRWRTKGLIPRPQREGLGRGKGTISRYPPGTDEQVIALSKLLSEDRRLELAAVALFFQGYPVSLGLIRDILSKDLSQWEGESQDILDSDGLTDKGWKILEEIANRRLKQRALTRARQRLRRSSFETFLHILAFILAGKFPDVLSESPELATEMDILKKGLGIEPALKSWLDLNDEELRTSIASYVSQVNVGTIKQTLHQISDADLISSRDRLLTFWQALQDANRISSAILKRDAFGIGRVPEIDLRHPDPLSQLLLLGWIQLQMTEGAADSISSITSWATLLSEIREQIDTNPEIVPRLREGWEAALTQ